MLCDHTLSAGLPSTKSKPLQQLHLATGDVRPSASPAPLPLCSRHKYDSLRLCEIDCVPFCPRKRPSDISVRRIIAHNAIIQTHERPAAPVGLTGAAARWNFPSRRAFRRRSLQIRSDFDSGREIRR